MGRTAEPCGSWRATTRGVHFSSSAAVPGTRLWDAGVDEVAVVSELLPRLAGGGRAASVQDALVGGGSVGAGGAGLVRRRPADRSSALLDAALDVYRRVDRSATSLVNQDLHGGNVLRAEREPWLVIDPKPLVGERELEASGLLRNADSRSLGVARYVPASSGSTASGPAAGASPTTSPGHGTRTAAGSEEHVEEARRILSAR